MERQSPRIAAIFDVDGTLIRRDSLERIFLKFLWRYGELDIRDFARLAAAALVAGGSAWRSQKAYLKGKDATHLRRLARDCFEQEIVRRLLPGAIERVRWHQRVGHSVILLSGTLDVLLAPLAEHLGVTARVGTELEVAGRCLTGRVAGVHPFGAAKAECLQAMNRTGVFDLTRSFAYGDRYADRYLLAAVGHPIAANADCRLRRIAERHGWLIEDFTRGSEKTDSIHHGDLLGDDHYAGAGARPVRY
jgi:putative phosphoserine phosphatase/1-acylglycerol-3-phosphate O-acyltransferase